MKSYKEINLWISSVIISGMSVLAYPVPSAVHPEVSDNDGSQILKSFIGEMGDSK